MGFLNNLQFSIDKESDCGFLTAIDINTYPVSLDGGDRERSEVGIALFWTIDGWATVLSADLSNSDTNWQISATNGNSYEVRFYVVPAWENILYSQNAIVWYDGYFYISTLDGDNAARPDTLVNWTVLDEDDHATFQTNLYTGSSVNYGYTASSQYTDCPLFSAQRTGPHLWEISDNSGGVSGLLARVRNYEGDLIETLSWSGGKASFSPSVDGMYYVDFTWGNEERAMIAMPDLSDAQLCMKNLVKYIACKCNDPCDPDCPDMQLVQRRRDEFKNLQGLYWAVLGMVHVDRIKYNGIIDYDTERADLIHDVGAMIEQMNIISERCALCSSDDSNDVNC